MAWGCAAGGARPFGPALNLERGFEMDAKGKWSKRADIVARWFGVDRTAAWDAQATIGTTAPPICLRGGQVILLTGPSGAGKSTLLQRLRREYNRQAAWLDLQRVGHPRGALVIDVMADALGGDNGRARDRRYG